MTWVRAADRGQLDMSVLTAAKVREGGATLPECGQYLGVLHTDFATVVPIVFLTLEDLLLFINEMAPREVLLFHGAGESVGEVGARLQAAVDEQKRRAAEIAEAVIARATRH